MSDSEQERNSENLTSVSQDEAVLEQASNADGELSESSEKVQDGEGDCGDQNCQGDCSESTATKIDADYVQRLEKEAKENYDKYLRAVAEFENFRKRAEKQRSEFAKYAGEALGRDLLEIVDNLYLAFSDQNKTNAEEFYKGVKLIFDRFVTVLEQNSIKGESFLGKAFDPNTQQALASVATNEQAPGTVIEEYKRAYFFKDKLLRPAQVIVAAALEETQSSEELATGGETN